SARIASEITSTSRSYPEKRLSQWNRSGPITDTSQALFRGSVATKTIQSPNKSPSVENIAFLKRCCSIGDNSTSRIEKGIVHLPTQKSFAFRLPEALNRSESSGTGASMWVLIRAVTYATFFIGFLFVFLPARVLSWSGISEPAIVGIWQVAGIIVA